MTAPKAAAPAAASRSWPGGASPKNRTTAKITPAAATSEPDHHATARCSTIPYHTYV